MSNAGADHKQGEGGGGSGGHSISGYEYQIDVSVWLALELVLANRMTQELILEPASEEDIEGFEGLDEDFKTRVRELIEEHKVELERRFEKAPAPRRSKKASATAPPSPDTVARRRRALRAARRGGRTG